MLRIKIFITTCVFFIFAPQQTMLVYGSEPNGLASAKHRTLPYRQLAQRQSARSRAKKVRAVPTEELIAAVSGIALGSLTFARSPELIKFYRFTESDDKAVVGDIAIAGLLTILASFSMHQLTIPLGHSIGATSIALGFLGPVFLSLSTKNLYHEDYKIHAELVLECFSRMLAEPKFKDSFNPIPLHIVKVSHLIKYISWKIDETGAYPNQESKLNASGSQILAHQGFYEVEINDQNGNIIFRSSFKSLTTACKVYIREVASHLNIEEMLVWDVNDFEIKF